MKKKIYNTYIILMVHYSKKKKKKIFYFSYIKISLICFKVIITCGNKNRFKELKLFLILFSYAYILF
jgi:hypothetical protein